MENKQQYFIVQAILQNFSDKPLLIKSPDFPDLNNQFLPVGFSSPMQFIYPTNLKLRNNSWINQQGNRVVYLELVDKEF